MPMLIGMDCPGEKRGFAICYEMGWLGLLGLFAKVRKGTDLPAFMARPFFSSRSSPPKCPAA